MLIFRRIIGDEQTGRNPSGGLRRAIFTVNLIANRVPQAGAVRRGATTGAGLFHAVKQATGGNMRQRLKRRQRIRINHALPAIFRIARENRRLTL
jgi:hypothetical protein